MDTIDELGRRAARAALTDAERYADVESGLARILAADELDPATMGPRRRWVVLAAAAAVVAVGTAAIVWSQRDPAAPTVPSGTSEPTTPTSPPTRPAAGLRVSYLDPPPVLDPHVFATVDLPADGSLLDVAVTDTGGAVTIDSEQSEAIVVELDGTTRRLPVECRCTVAAAGPGDVLYAFVQGTTDGPTLVAVPLSGDQAGQVVASRGLPRQWEARLPHAAIGHGREGLVDRRSGEEFSEYFDTVGQPLTWADAPPVYVMDEPLPGTVVYGINTVDEWPLDIERHPDYVGPRLGESPPAPTTDGNAVYWTGIGTPDDPINVIAVLSPDGSGRWYRLPEGWSVAASDVWGTILARQDGDRMELATFAPRSQSEPGTTVTPTTAVPTTAAPPTAAGPSPVVTLAEAMGATQLVVREPGRVTVFRDGAPTEVATPRDVYVQTDGTMLWWNTITDGETTRSTAATLDGTVVCEVDGVIHRIREDPDAGYIASVERPNASVGEAAETPVPNFAVDCETGESQPIDPVSWTREGGSRYVEDVAERTFMFEGDAEGNADGTNESGVSINGDDYAGYHTFSADGSRVVYGDMSALASPHVTNVLRARDTTTGELLWSAELDRPITVTYWYGDRIVALVPTDGVPGATYEAVIVLDALTGDVITTVPTALDIAFVG